MFTALLLLSIINYTASKWQGFKISDGHLEIMSYKDKNITLLTPGEGYVNLGYDNILEVTRKVQSASAIVDRSKKDVSEISQTLESLQEIVSEIESGILHLENTTGITLNPVSANRMILFIRVQARTIRAQITAIKATILKDECETNPCRNGGTCLDLYNKFYCLCPKNWEGPTCESDVNECAIFQGTDIGCQNDAICTNLQGSYKCECRDGWIGMHCKSLKRDCDISGSEELCGHGHCFNNDGKIACLCHQGWSMDLSGQCTIDVNECASKQAVCSHDPYVECYNTPGSFHCGACPRGYSGNGYYCSDVNECEINNGGCSEFPKVQCINTPGSRVCGECPAFYTGDGINCIEETGGTCDFNNGGCHPNALCTPILGSGGKFVRCTCNFGYSGDGIGPNGCVEVDKSTLVKNYGCAPGGCHNGGTCQAVTPFDYECVCPPFYTGPHCDVRLRHPCDIKPCMNGGLCVEDVNSMQGQFKCLCQLGYIGSICETLSDDCFGSSNLPHGNLMFPFLHASTRQSVVCQWIISVDPEKLIQIRFNSLNLSVNTNCSSYIEIHDIRPFAKQVLIKICNSHDVSKVFLKPTTNALEIYAKLPNNEDSFSISWNSINASCTKYIAINDSYLIESPGYPKNYSSNLDCYWHLEAMEGKQIEFVFYVVSIDESSKCDKDYLQVFEQSFGNSFQSLLTTCSKFKTISSVKSKTHQALLHFHSDHSGSSAGFKIGANVVAGCGKFLTHTAEEIVYPPTDGSSKGNGFCEWRIHLPIGEKVQFSFDEFNLQDCQEECACQNLKIYDGSNIVEPYCGDNKPGERLSETNTVSIVLYSQDSVDASKGFRMHYTANCGGTFKESSGEFTSPYYPHHYPDDRVCEYLIEQPEKKRIKLQVLDFDVENPSWARGTCGTNFLEIRDSIDIEANLIGPYCGGPRKIPSEIVSSFNHLYLKFSTDGSGTFKGFKIAYSTIDVVCGGIFKDMQGTISSPLEDGAYPPNTVCTWIIIAPVGHIIDINFISFHLVWTYDCDSDSFNVFENSTSTGEGRRLHRLCGWSTAPPITSTWNMVTLVLKTDDWLNRDGFKLNYTMINATHNCGSTFHSPSGEIRSPNFPENYPVDALCTWKIEAPSGQQIRLTFIDFHLIRSDKFECDEIDNLEIRDGSNENSPLIKRFCGETLPAPILSYTNKLFIKLESKWEHGSKGFHIKWDSSSTGCGGILTAPSGFITTPNFPRHYYKNTECIWKITVNHGSNIQLEFEKLVLQSHDMCKTDRLEIYDGINSAAKKLGHYCSSNLPPRLITSGNNVFIKFITDASEEYDGFQLNYTAICNTTLTGRHGIIESLNFPDFYPLDSNCFWYIIIPGGSNISIQFTHYDVNRFKSLCFDYVEILTNKNESLKKLYCSMPDSVIIANTSVYIHFKSNVVASYIRFRLEWFVKGCGGILKNEDVGNFTSPGFPDPYPANVVCEWYISVPLKQAIQFSIKVYHIQNSTNCMDDSLKIYGGQDDTAPLLSTLCNERTITRQVTVSGSHAFVRFISDSSHQGKGFYISYYKTASVCGGSIEGPSGQIISHNYPNNYEPNQYCEWNVFVQYNHVINLTFVDFDVVPSSSGGFNRVLVYDYDMSSGFTKTLFNETGRLEDLNSTSIISSTNNILIRHQSDSAMTAKGFRAVYHEACGYHNQLEDKFFFAIDYAPQDTVCVFYITTSSANQLIKLSVSSIILKPDTNISIYNGDSDDERLLLKVLNGTKAPPDILSSGPAMTIKLMNPYRQHVQFIASYSRLVEDCGGYITSEAGTIASPNFPNGYPENIECIWYITPSLGNNVTLTFSEFELDSQNDPFCNQDYVEVRDRNETGDLLGLYCKDNVPKYDTYGMGLWMKFRSDSNGTARGFVADYKLSHEAALSGRDGALQSPLYPSMYSGKGTFLWTITVPKGNQIKISFFEFYVSDAKTGNECTNRLMILDVDPFQTPLLSTCGVDKPDSLTSPSNRVQVKLEQITESAKSNFYLHWEAVPIKYDDYDDEDYPSPSEVCTYHIYLENKPGKQFRKLHTDNQTEDCIWYGSDNKITWIIETPPFYQLLLNFVKCKDVEVRTEASDGLWKFYSHPCKGRNNTLTIAKKRVKLVHSHDLLYSRVNLDVDVAIVCGGTVKFENSIILDTFNLPPNNTYRLQYCSWTITTTSGRTIRAVFENMTLPKGENNICSLNYLLLRNGAYEDSPYLGQGKFCGLNSVPDLETSSNKLHISLQQQYVFVNVTGVKLKLIEVGKECGQNINLKLHEIVNISTINYPALPPPKITCIWKVTAPLGHSIQIDFGANVKFERSCEEESVTLKEGLTEESRVMKHVCNRTTPLSSEVTEGNHLFIMYYSDIEEPTPFTATIKITTCGGTLNLDNYDTTLITSPNYPDKYSISSNCSWFVKMHQHPKMKITFKEFDVGEPLNNCTTNADHLEIINLNEFTNKPTGTNKIFCGKVNEGKTYITETSSVEIKLITGIKLLPTSQRKFSLSIDVKSSRCSHHYESSSGMIESPGYPAGQLPASCTYNIQAEPDHAIRITFLEYDLDKESYLYAYENINPYGYRFDSTGEKNVSLLSSSNKLVISYYMYKHSLIHHGFKLHYTTDELPGCGGDLDASGVIFFPTNPNTTVRVCQWQRINTDKASTFALSIQGVLQKGYHETSCSDANVTLCITEESCRSATATECGDYEKPTALMGSPFSVTKIILRLSFINRLSAIPPYTNFSLTYKTHPCGGIISSQTNVTITSPGYPEDYPPDTVCTWQVSIDFASHIQVTFDFIDIDPSKDYLSIFSYFYSLKYSHLIDKYTGNLLPQPIYVSRNTIWLHFYSDSITQGKGFRINITSSEYRCGGIEHDNFGYIASENYYKGDYLNNMECEWEIRTSVGQYILLTFDGRFHLENSTNCTKDYVKLFDYIEDDWISIDKPICGRPKVPFSYKSKSTRMKLLFHSDEDITGSGFQASWTFECGGTILLTGEKNNGVITSPNYPRTYPSSLTCEYYIIAPGRIIIGSFLDLDLEDGEDGVCTHDNLTISTVLFLQNRQYYTPFPHQYKLTYCGNNIPLPSKSWDKMLLQFKTDSQIEKTGFFFTFNLDSCGYVEINESTVINIPKAILDCSWNIYAPKDKIIVIKFRTTIKQTRLLMYTCRINYLRLIEFGNKTRDICFTLMPKKIVSTSNNMTIELHRRFTASSFLNTSIAISFSHSCKHTVILNETSSAQILSPLDTNNDGNYEPDLDCEWLILAPMSYTVKVTFVNMDIEQCADCTCDHIQIFDGDSTTATLIGTFCGSNLYPTIMSSMNEIFISFVSNSFTEHSGFRLRIEPVLSPCGISRRMVSGNEIKTLTSPGWDQRNYNSDLNCTWILATNDTREKIFIHFVELDIEKSTNCTKNKLIIKDLESELQVSNLLPRHRWENDIQSLMERKICEKNETDYRSKSNAVLVKFFSDHLTTGKGFKLEYKLYDCTLNLVDPYGKIDIFETYSSCKIQIKAPRKNDTISLYFSYIEIFSTFDCKYNNLQIFDSDKKDEIKLIGTVCGSHWWTPIYSSGPNMYILYNSLKNFHGTFEMLYTTTDKGEGCGGRLLGENGIIIPFQSRKDSVCRWDVSVPHSSSVDLKFIDFNIGSDDTCETDYLQIVETGDGIGQQRYQFCGQDTPKSLQLSTNSFYIRYVTSIYNDGTGWILRFSSKSS